MKTYFVISDIHGRAINGAMFKRMGFEEHNPDHYIVALGDYFDRGLENKTVYRFFTKLKHAINDRCILIYGNHDQYIMEFCDVIERTCTVGNRIEIDWPQFDRWMANGGFTTLDEMFGSINGMYTLKKQQNILKLKQFTELLIPYYETDAYIFTHAQIDDNRKIDVWNRTFIHEGLETPKTVVIGHTPHPYLDEKTEIAVKHADTTGEPYCYAYSTAHPKCRVLNIDTGLGNNIVVLTEDAI